MNLANEPEAWDEDFSYAYLERLYVELKNDFDVLLLGDASEVPPATGSRRQVFIRHDVDVSIDRALDLARKEAGWQISSTYHVMIDSPFYNARSDSSMRALAEISALGHEIGLHYNIVARNKRQASSEERDADIARACEELEAIVGSRTRSLSFHLPVEELLRGPLKVAGRVSGYAKELFAWYLSDSRARWREGEPIAALNRPRSSVLQLLIHPVWWGEGNTRPSVRLRELLRPMAVDAPSYEVLRARMWDHIVYRAADFDG